MTICHTSDNYYGQGSWLHHELPCAIGNLCYHLNSHKKSLDNSFMLHLFKLMKINTMYKGMGKT